MYVERTTAYTRSPSASALASGLRTTHTAPSERTYPLAPASNDLQRPSGDSIPALLNPTVRSGVNSELAPPTMARAMSPRHRAWQARSRATRDDEHAVSTDRLGPRRSRA